MNRKTYLSATSSSGIFKIGKPVIITSSNGKIFMLEQGDKINVISANESHSDSDVTRLYHRNEKYFQADKDMMIEGHHIRKGDKIRITDNQPESEADDLEALRKNLERKQHGFKSKLNTGYDFGRKQSFTKGTEYKE